MEIHRTTGRWRWGLTLALTSTLFWGSLPVAMKGVLSAMSPDTITWFRFSAAALVLGVIVLPKSGLPSRKKLTLPVAILLGVATVALCGNYVIY
ncbi:MAG: EamA family transporter, partial [Planctomycetota bacterium]